MSELLSFTGAQAAERIKAGEISADELFGAYRERAAAEDLNAFLWVADRPDERADTSGPLSTHGSRSSATGFASWPISPASGWTWKARSLR